MDLSTSETEHSSANSIVQGASTQRRSIPCQRVITCSLHR